MTGPGYGTIVFSIVIQRNRSQEAVSDRFISRFSSITQRAVENPGIVRLIPGLEKAIAACLMRIRKPHVSHLALA